MSDKNSEARAESSSGRFLSLLKNVMPFAPTFPSSEELKGRIVELVAFGHRDEAVGLIRAKSGLAEAEAHELVSAIEVAADRIHYATGLRP